MIVISDKHDCCGCAACVNACPKQCISMKEDSKGFLYPQVDSVLCVDCGLCEKVCPVLWQREQRKPLYVYAAFTLNEQIRRTSSSGGVFSVLAESVIDEGGVVFGAKFDENWEVKHDYVETKGGLEHFRSSKYLQSRIGSSYLKVRDFLKEGRKVLFSGTACQIAGLKHFLRKDYENLLTVEVVCHGVPSPLVWRNYLRRVLRPKGVAGKNTVLLSLKDVPVITGISFREKRTGWKKYGFVVRGNLASKAGKNSVLSSVYAEESDLIRESKSDNYYMQVFLHDLDLRPSCYKCPSKEGKSQSDIALADFWCIWNIQPELDDDKGVSAILINSNKGEQFVRHLDIQLFEQKYSDFVKGNPAYVGSAKETLYTKVFWVLNKFSLYKGVKMLIFVKRVIDKLMRIV